MLWLCLNFPQLPLELHARAEPISSPWAIIEGKGARKTILQCNDAAAELGIRPGMTPGAAYALAHNLQLRSRDETAERQALESLADWAGQYTSFVSLRSPNALLLEVAGSLRLFKGMAPLLDRIPRQTAELGYATRIGVAPTPLAAWLLARTQIPNIPPKTIMEINQLPATLRELPLELLDLEPKQIKTLHGLGLKRLGELLRLPRAGLARRFSPGLVDYLDRLLGNSPDPLEAYTPPPRFVRQLWLPAETNDREALLFPARRLLLELTGFLDARQAGTQWLHWRLIHHNHHHHRPATHVTLGLAAPNRDPEHLLALLRERLSRVTLEHAVEGIGLSVTNIRPLRPRTLSLDTSLNSDLDGNRHSDMADWPRLVERLRARLGDEAVRGFQPHPDHRPELAWKTSSPGAVVRDPGNARRPLWLLPKPVALSWRDGTPWLDGRLAIESGPERIESGWWDEGDVARDYFIASDAAHGCYWIYRERYDTRRWFLHGLFA